MLSTMASITNRNIPNVVIYFAVMVIAGFLAGGRHQGKLQDAQANFGAAKQEAQEGLARVQAAEKDVHKARSDLIEDQDKALRLHKELAKQSERKVEEPKIVEAMPPSKDWSYTVEPCLKVDNAGKHSQLPIYLMVIGIEGAGHHALETVWKGLEDLYDVKMVTYNPGLHSFTKDVDVERAYQYSSIDIRKHEQQFAGFLKKPWVRGKPLIIDTRNSYPMGFGVGSVGHPDLRYLTHFDGKLFDLRVLVLWRDPASCVLSAVRRFKVKEFQYKNYEYQARVVQESLTVINNALTQVPCGKYKVLDYADFTHHPAKYAEDIAKLASVDPAHIASSFSDLVPVSKKNDTAQVAIQRRQLEDFFKQQEKLWPILSGQIEIPPVELDRPMLPTMSRQDVLPNKDGKEKYLQIKWFSHLGFNNVRFILEMMLMLGNLINRTLIVPSHLRMRKCTDDSLCSKANCELRKNFYWCPFSHFIEAAGIKSHNGLIVKDETAFVKSRSVKVISDGFGAIYSKDKLWLDKLPKEIEHAIESDHTVNRRVKLQYWGFHLGCELSYFRHNKKVWDQNKVPHVFGFVNEYGGIKEDVLNIQGTPHHIGLTPVMWTSINSLEASRQVWEDGVNYDPKIVKFAAEVSQKLNSESPTGSYVCVHLRRGDFITAGWLGKAQDLSLVRDNIAAALQQGEKYYLATDESDDEVLKDLLAIGARRWSGYVSALVAAHPDSAGMLGFEDYVGLIEQMICANARLFLGSKCSSFTGGILNLRRKIYGDTSYHTVISPPT